MLILDFFEFTQTLFLERHIVPAKLSLAFKIKSGSHEANYTKESKGLFWEIFFFGFEELEVDTSHNKHFSEKLAWGGKSIVFLEVGV